MYRLKVTSTKNNSSGNGLTHLEHCSMIVMVTFNHAVSTYIMHSSHGWPFKNGQQYVLHWCTAQKILVPNLIMEMHLN